MKLSGHTKQFHTVDYQRFKSRRCGDRDNFVGVATLSKIIWLIISDLDNVNVATQFHGSELQKTLSGKRLIKKYFDKKA